MDITIEQHIRNLGVQSPSDVHELIVECLEFHGLSGTNQLTVEQVEEFWRHKYGGRTGWRNQMLRAFMGDSYS